MADIRRRIERAIGMDPVTKKGLQRGIVNSRALTRCIRKTDGLDSTADATLGNIRRYALSSGESEEVRRAFRDCGLSLRNNLELEYDQDTMNRIGEFGSNLKTVRGENVKLVAGVQFMRVIADQNALENFRKTVQPTHVIRYSKNHA